MRLILHPDGEATWCEIKLRSNSILVGVIYRPPNSSRDKNLLLSDLIRLSENFSNTSQVLLCGDFNFSEIN